MVVKQFTDLKARFSSVHELIKYRVTEILLISTIYDGFILEEDGQLTEQIYHQFSDLSIPYIPRIPRRPARRMRWPSWRRIRSTW